MTAPLYEISNNLVTLNRTELALQDIYGHCPNCWVIMDVYRVKTNSVYVMVKCPYCEHISKPAISVADLFLWKKK